MNNKLKENNHSLIYAIIGDVIGSIYEFHPHKSTDIEMTNFRMFFTDDTVMSVAVADWILTDKELSKETLVNKMQHWGHRYPHAGYGGMFSQWLRTDNPQPYNSFGNGSAMRVSAVGFAFSTLEETLEIAKRSAEVTHNHPEGIKGAQATAAAIFMARNGSSKEEIKNYITESFGYDLNRTCDEIRPYYEFNETCQHTVPESIIAFLESKDYEEAIKLTISLGADADTMGAITGAIAGAYYNSVPVNLYEFAMNKLAADIKKVVLDFDTVYAQ